MTLCRSNPYRTTAYRPGHSRLLRPRPAVTNLRTDGVYWYFRISAPDDVLKATSQRIEGSIPTETGHRVWRPGNNFQVSRACEETLRRIFWNWDNAIEAMIAKEQQEKLF